MTQRLFFVVLFTGLLVLALGGWTVNGMQWVVTGEWMRMPRNLLNLVNDRCGAAASLPR